LLESAGLGDPREYLNKDHRKANGSFDRPDDEYIESLLEGHRGSIWGTKTVRLQFLEKLVATAGVDYIIRLTRRDTIRQAVSLYRARSTGQWGYDAENDAPRQSVEFDRQAIQAALDQIHGHVDRWEAFLESTDIPVLRLTYEDLVANMDAEVRVLAMDMGYPVGPATPITTPTLRASDDLTDDLVRKFLGE